MDRKISVRFLKLGMFVSKLDRPWLGTPFPFQGFVIESRKQIGLLKKYCKTLYIDPERGEPADSYLEEQPEPPKKKLFENTVEYPEVNTLEAELPAAKKALEAASQDVEEIMENIRVSQRIDMKAIRQVVTPILESIIRNSDAFMWLSQLREKDSHIYTSAVDGSALAVALGRHIGLPIENLQNLAIGVLLMDIGKTQLPKDILEKSHNLTDEELIEFRKHVDYGIDLLRGKAGITQEILAIVATHHEHYDGSGYPNRLKGAGIPIYGRMAAVIDSYIGLTTARDTGELVSPHEALQIIYNFRDRYFQDEIIEQMLQCLGVYPTGTLVEMSNGEVGIVMAQNRKRRLRPKVMLLLDSNKQAYKDYKVVDLIDQIHDEEGRPYDIQSTLQPGDYGIDAQEFYLAV
ncbi:MAG: HD-GYP domain-containing protein [Gammaproteobacteria bacterium]|nr:MAG: HD-GYP domain-containing protein [Gammaproteobacteria bacterium]